MPEIKNFILHSGEVKALEGSANEDQMLISGWASTKDIDLANDIVLPNAFQKRWDYYAKKGRYWFNHDPTLVIGSVRKCRLNDNGFYIDEAKLSETKFVKEFIWPNVKEGALNEHSIQFQSFDPEMKDGILYHKDVMVLETSIVSLACNPGAVITGFKSLIPSEDYFNATLEQLAKLDSQGLLKYPSDIRKDFYVSGLNNENNMLNIENLMTDLIDMRVISRDEKTYDPNGEVDTEFKMPSAKSKRFETVCDTLYLTKSNLRNKHMFKIAQVTKNGWRYDWNSVAIALGTAFGAKGVTHFAADEKVTIVKELMGIYAKLGKALPTHEGETLDNLSDEALTAVKFHEIDFHEAEDQVIRAEIAKSNAKALSDAITYWRKNDGIPEDVMSYIKSVYPEFSAYISIYPEDDESRAFLSGLLALYETYREAREARFASYKYSLDGVETEEKGRIIAARMLSELNVDAKYLEKTEDSSEEAPEEAPVEASNEEIDEDLEFFGK
jgi:HK97 family phage prohead protease